MYRWFTLSSSSRELSLEEPERDSIEGRVIPQRVLNGSRVQSEAHTGELRGSYKAATKVTGREKGGRKRERRKVRAAPSTLFRIYFSAEYSYMTCGSMPIG